MNEIFKIYGSILLQDEAFIKGLKEALDKAEQTKNQMAQKFEQVGQAFNKIGQGITKSGTILTGTLSAGIAGLATAGVKYNMEMENFHMNLTTLLGSSEKATKLLDDLKEMAATTPFETNDLISATQTMIGFGIASDDAQKYLGMIGDIAMGDANKLSGLSLAFSQVQSTGRLTGQDLLQMVNQGFNPLKYISDMTGKSMATLKEEMGEGKISAKMVGDAFAYATSKGQPFYQGMENGAKTVSGRISTLKDNFQILIGNLTEGLLPVFEKVVDYLTQLTDKFMNLSQEQKDQIIKWAGIVAAIGPALIIIGKMVSGLGGLFSIIGKVKGAGGLAGLAAKFSALLPVIGPVIGVIAGVVAGIALLVHVLGGPKEALEKLKEAFEKVKQTITTFLERIDFKDKLQEIKDKFSELSEKLKGLGDFLKVLGTIIGAILVPMMAVWSGAFNGVMVVIGPVIDIIGGLIDILAGLGSFIVGIFTGDLKKAGDAVLKIGEGIKNVFGGLFDGIFGFLVGFVEGVVEFFVSLWDTLVGHSIVPDTINAIIDWFKQLLGKPIQFVKELKDKVIGFFSDLGKKALQGITNFVNNTKEKFNSMKTAVANKANEIKTNVVNKFNEMKTNASEKFNSLKTSASEKFNSMKTAIVNKANEIKTNAVNKFNEMKTNATSKFESLKSSASSKFESIKSTITNKVSQAKDRAVSLFQSLNTASGGKLGSLASTVSSKMSAVYNNIKDKMESAKNKVTSILSSMKSAFSNWTAKIKMPHIKITGDWDLKKLKFPKFSVDWYAKGGIFDKPTIFPTDSGLKGVGEAGPEAVAPISALQKYVQVAVDNSNSGLEERLDMLTSVLLNYLPLLAEKQIVMDTGQLVGSLVNPMDKALADKSKDRRRGR